MKAVIVLSQRKQRHIFCACASFLSCAVRALQRAQESRVQLCFRPVCFALLYQQVQMPLKIRRKSRWAKCSGREKKSEGRHTVRSNEICYSGPFYTRLITRSNRFCETPSPFEDTPTTHVIWLVFYMRYQPRPIMRADHNVPVIRLGGGSGSVRWNHNLGQLKTDPWISGSNNAL